MGLKGDLQNLNLGDVFQALGNNKQEGTLVVSDGESTKHIYFQKGKVCFLASGKKRGLKLGRILIRRGKVTSREVDIAINKQSRIGGLLGNILVEMGLCSDDDVVEAVRFQIQEEIFSLFTWKNATFEFLETLPEENIFNDSRIFEQTSFDVNGLLLEAARRVDEWSRIEEKLPSFKEIYKVVDDTSSRTTKDLTKNDTLGVVLGLVDGRRDLEQVIEEAAIGYFETCEVLSDLIDEHRIAPVQFEELIKVAEEYKSTDNPEQAAAFYTRAVAMQPRDVEIRMALAGMYKQSGRTEDVVTQLKEVALIFCSKREMERAAEVLSEAELMMPGDLDSKERLYQLYVEMNDVERAIEVGKQLAQRLRRTGDLLKKKEVYEALVGLRPTDQSLRKLLINNYLDMGDTEKAIDQYEILAESLMTEGRRDKVVEVYRKILTCDPKRHDIKWRLDNLFVGETRKIKRRKFMIVGSIVGALFTGLVSYQLVANDHFGNLLPKVKAAVNRKDYDEAIDDYEKHVQAYPWTLTALDASGKVLELKEDRAEENNKRKLMIAKVREYIAGGNTDSARRLLSGLVEEYRETIYAEELEAWLSSVKASIQAAEQLYEQGRSYERRGDVRMAFEAYSKLFSLYGNSKYAKNIRFPVRVETRPAGAQVAINGKLLGRTPLTIAYDPHKSFQLELRSPDFETMQIHKVNSWMINESLLRKAKWTYKTKQPVEGSGLVVGRNFIIGGRDGHVYNFDVPTGIIRWEYVGGTISDIVSRIEASQDTIFFGSVNGKMTALDLTSGRKKWQFETGHPVRSSPTYIGKTDTLLVPGGNGTVFLLDARTGRKKLNVQTGTDTVGEAVVIGNHAIFGTVKGKLICYDLEDKKTAWSVDLDGTLHAAPAVAGKTLYVGTGRGNLYAIDSNTGSIQWNTKIGREIFGTPALNGTKVYAGTSDYKISAVDRAEGSIVWSFNPDGQVYSSPIVHKDTLYVGSINGSMMAIDAMHGTLKWQYKAGGPIYGAASIYKDQVLFGSGDYRIYSLTR